jgi:hypothetical protein
MAPRIIFATPPGNPLLQVLYLLVGGLLLVGAVFLGAIILAVVVGFALVFGLVLWVRLWWLRRKFVRANPGAQQSNAKSAESSGTGGVEITDVEYRVVGESEIESDSGSRHE